MAMSRDGSSEVATTSRLDFSGQRGERSKAARPQDHLKSYVWRVACACVCVCVCGGCVCAWWGRL